MAMPQHNPFYASAQYRHECEVRMLCKMRYQSKTRGKVDDYLTLVEKKRGEESRVKLNADFVQQYAMGNRGEFDVWLM